MEPWLRRFGVFSLLVSCPLLARCKSRATDQKPGPGTVLKAPAVAASPAPPARSLAASAPPDSAAPSAPSAAPGVASCKVGSAIDISKLMLAVRGSFSKSDASEIVGDMECPAQGDGANATVLARQSGDRWLVVEAAEADDARVTHEARKKIDTGRGVQLVLTHDSSGTAGRLYHSISVADHSMSPKSTAQDLISVADTTGAPCDPNEPPVAAEIVGIDVRDVDHDGDDDVRIQLRAGKVDCHGRPAPGLRTLEFSMNDGKLEATPATRKIVSEIQALGD